ncbi:hypothetical protein POX_c04504 [Penicillium oxalicum]|uniref:hypothetical protein n=1 Tax=Penicillium oxalicum TaxID=69781 RepID=UPI0020B8BFD8|nr:hypothetical protein POX_c04504 [Penicillium oxalicum]KAI2791638.1 hypothetical protein POX_c04504 [Penicillium oxalicum]
MTRGSRYVHQWNEGTDLPKDLSKPETGDFLIQYTKIEPKNMEKHIIHVLPLLQKFMFLQLDLYHSPSYKLVLEQIRRGNLFLDLGCALGQDIRRLVYDGAPSENLIGLELRGGFVDLGYELFQDKSHLQSQFLVQSFFEDTPKLTSLRGKVKVVNSGMFMHLWGWEKQVEVAKRMMELLVPEEGSMITGLHFGSWSAKMWETMKESPMFVHSPDTLKSLWNQCAQETGTCWEFQCLVEEADDCQDLDSEALKLRWTAKRLNPLR